MPTEEKGYQDFAGAITDQPVHYWRCQSCGHVVLMSGEGLMAGFTARGPQGCGNCNGGGAWDYLGYCYPNLNRSLGQVTTATHTSTDATG